MNEEEKHEPGKTTQPHGTILTPLAQEIRNDLREVRCLFPIDSGKAVKMYLKLIEMNQAVMASVEVLRNTDSEGEQTLLLGLLRAWGDVSAKEVISCVAEGKISTTKGARDLAKAYAKSFEQAPQTPDKKKLGAALSGLIEALKISPGLPAIIRQLVSQFPDSSEIRSPGIAGEDPEVVKTARETILSIGEDAVPAIIEVFLELDSKSFGKEHYIRTFLLITLAPFAAKENTTAREFLNKVANKEVSEGGGLDFIARAFLDNSKDKKRDSSNCFIATAACGVDSVEVRILRQFRDAVLLKSVFGRIFVRTYYRVSPPVASMIKTSPRAQYAIRRVLVHPLAKLAERKISHQND